MLPTFMEIVVSKETPKEGGKIIAEVLSFRTGTKKKTEIEYQSFV